MIKVCGMVGPWTPTIMDNNCELILNIKRKYSAYNDQSLLDLVNILINPWLHIQIQIDKPVQSLHYYQGGGRGREWLPLLPGGRLGGVPIITRGRLGGAPITRGKAGRGTHYYQGEGCEGLPLLPGGLGGGPITRGKAGMGSHYYQGEGWKGLTLLPGGRLGRAPIITRGRLGGAPIITRGRLGGAPIITREGWDGLPLPGRRPGGAWPCSINIILTSGKTIVGNTIWWYMCKHFFQTSKCNKGILNLKL